MWSFLKSLLLDGLMCVLIVYQMLLPPPYPQARRVDCYVLLSRRTALFLNFATMASFTFTSVLMPILAAALWIVDLPGAFFSPSFFSRCGLLFRNDSVSLYSLLTFAYFESSPPTGRKNGQQGSLCSVEKTAR
jgi:hypothetical protein